MKDQKFDDAYKQISKGMAANKDVEAWAKEQKYIFQTGEVKIFKFEVFAGQGRGRHRKGAEHPELPGQVSQPARRRRVRALHADQGER